MRPEPAEVSRPTWRERSVEHGSRDVREMLAQARPDQILRLLDDIRTCEPSDYPRGTA
ncbi:hypothetical protein [Roseovarius sp. D22-M7]|uniref:hypothetical protein n=1 Tax=Roseovarius sp. D22-M7 TaxID=3127116 RepID=UPI003010187D